MQSPLVSFVEIEVSRIRELSKHGRHAEALAAAQSLVDQAPQDGVALYLVAANQRCLNRIAEALETIERLQQRHPQFGLLYQERGHCYVTLRDAGRAVAAFLQAVRLNPALAASWIMLDRLYRMLRLVPDYQAARFEYARVLIDRQKYPQAEEVIGTLRGFEPGRRDYLSLHAAACVGLGQHERAIVLYRELLAATPESCELDVALGHSLKSVGRQEEAIQAYQGAAAIRPDFGDAYWSLANLKTYRFSAEEIERVLAAEASPATQSVDRYHLRFALGKAYEDRKEYAESWRFYERGNELKRAEARYDPQIIENEVRKQIEVCTAEFFAQRKGTGAPHPDPIFIVGLPRSGSTLIEQILASHSQVEGTRELPDVPRIAGEMAGYPGVLADVAPEEFRRLGEQYIDDTRVYRTSKAFFIDKMPNNFRHIGLIHLMLPNARIIDARREPMACCFSNWKQLFAGGQEFSYSIRDLASYYRTYLDLMRHWDAVLPGRVLRVQYEDVVEDLEGSVRRLLEFCGLDFDPACVAFHKTERSVQTASSEQVRQPIFRQGLFEWREYEPWLGALQDGLGDALIRYRE